MKALIAAAILLAAGCDARPVATPTAPPSSRVPPIATPGPSLASSPLPSGTPIPTAEPTSWVKVFELERGTLGDLVVGPDGLIAAGCIPAAEAHCGEHVIVVSTDGTVWQEVEVDIQADTYFSELRRVGDRFFALGYGHYGTDGGAMVWTSLDGRAWSRVESASFRGRAVADIIDSPSGAFATGYNAPIDSDNTSGSLLWPVHADGSFGNVRVVETRDRQPFAIGAIWTGEEFLAWGNDRWTERPTTLLASRDAKTWTYRAEIKGKKTGSVSQIVMVGGRLVGVGKEGRQFPLSPRAWTSDDAGRSWTMADVTPGDGAMWTVGMEGSKLIARGNTYPDSGQQFVSWSSKEGTSWSRLPDDEAMPALPGFSAFRTATVGDWLCTSGTFYEESPSRAAIYCRPADAH